MFDFLNPPLLGGYCKYCMYGCVCIVSCVGRGLAIGRSTAQGILPKCPKGFIFSVVNSDWEQPRGPNPWNDQASNIVY